MMALARTLVLVAALLAGACGTTATTQSPSPTADVMEKSGDKMTDEDKMTEDSGDKMEDDKMEDDKMMEDDGAR